MGFSSPYHLIATSVSHLIRTPKKSPSSDKMYCVFDNNFQRN